MSTSSRSVRPIKVEISEPQKGYDGFFRLEKYDVSYERFDGTMGKARTLEVFERGDAASVILVDPDEDEVFLVEQFRLPVRLRGGSGWLLEPPAGMIRAGETPEECLRREVIEETGYQVTELTEIARFFCSPGGSTERIFLYYGEVRATDKKGTGGGILRDGEDIRLERMTVDDFLARLARRELEDAKLIIGAQWLQARRARLPAEKSPGASREFNFLIKGTDRIVGYKTGSITAVRDVDVWVNPTDCDMIMDPFRGRSVSAAIRQAGADKYPDSERIKDDTIAKALAEALGPHRFVRPTTVVDTVPGALARTHNVKRIFHVAVVPGAIGENLVSRPETLEVCIDKVLFNIDRKNRALFGRKSYASVLFPILGTGQGGFFNADVVPRLVRRAIHFFAENASAKLRKIYFCAYSRSDQEILEHVLAQHVSAGELERPSRRKGAGALAS